MRKYTMSLKDRLPISLREKLRFVKCFCRRILYRALWIFPVDTEKIVFECYNGKGYGDNPKAIAEAFAKRGKGKMYWLTADGSASFPPYVTSLPYKSLRARYHLATAGIWIDNQRKEPSVVKRKNQFYLQTWHGSVALKKIEKDAENALSRFYVAQAKYDSRMTDLMLSNSRFTDDMYRRAFWYTGEIKRFGSPRLDALFRPKESNSIKSALGIPEEDYILLYAPTFRSSNSREAYDVDFAAVTAAIREKNRKNVTVLIRTHPNLLQEHLVIPCERSVNVSTYPDVYELIQIADAMITDYSSLMFEFPIAERKPVFCYARDLEQYDRGLYFKPEELPFPFARSNEDLIRYIKAYDPVRYATELSAFYARLELTEDGRAAERTVDYLMEKTGLH